MRLAVRAPVAELVLDRPATRNALTVAMLEELGRHLRTVAEDETVRVVLLRGSGDSAFCAGADLTAFRGLPADRLWRHWTRLGQEVFAALARLPQVTVAVLSGHAVGGGLELAAHCDLRIAARGSRLGLPEVKLGTLPGWSGMDRLADLIGLSRTRLLALTGRLIEAEDAAVWGLVDIVSGALATDVDRLVADLLRAGPVSQRILKARLAGALRGWPDPGALADSLGGAIAAFEGESGEGVSALLDKRVPTWVAQ